MATSKLTWNPMVELYHDGETRPFAVHNNIKDNVDLNFRISVWLRKDEAIQIRVRAMSSMSVGQLQYNAKAGNALPLLRDIVNEDKTSAQAILQGTTLYSEIVNGTQQDWNYRIVENRAEATALTNLLSSPAGVKVQN